MKKPRGVRRLNIRGDRSHSGRAAQEAFRQQLVARQGQPQAQVQSQAQKTARNRSIKFNRSAKQKFSASPVRTVELVHPLLPDLEDTEIDVSVIFGTYNRLPLLKKSIDSVRRACAGIRYEIVVTDGGSKDGSVAWLQEQKNVFYIPGDLSGAVPAFNAAARQARGKFILTFNDDAELQPTIVSLALNIMKNRQVGQVAFLFSEQQTTKIDTMFGRPYANFGLVRTNIVRIVEEITGGIWADCYRTYGGDNELSCWVYRLGYKVVPTTKLGVVHNAHSDVLRKNNEKRDRERNQFSQRWSADNLVFRGPLPNLRPSEVRKLQRIEMGESVQQRWSRLSHADPGVGHLPPRVLTKAERVLHWQLWTAEDPQTSMVAGLKKLGSAGHQVVRWTTYDVQARGQIFVNAMQSLRPSIAFLQCQDPKAVPIEALKTVREDPTRDPSLIVVVWSGDIGPGKGPWEGSNDAWQFAIAKHVDLMLFTGTGQVEHYRKRGMPNAAYLQIGYDTDRYYIDNQERAGIVFMGQNYGPHFDKVPQSEAQLRRDIVNALKSIPGFVAYGSGFGAPMDQAKSGDVYRKSFMAVSISLVSNLGRYTSDRMLRSMACGCPTLVKRFADMHGMGLVEDVNCIGWDTPNELVEKIRPWLGRREELLQIGRAGAQLMTEHHTWDVRMQELQAIVNTVRKQA